MKGQGHYVFVDQAKIQDGEISLANRHTSYFAADPSRSGRCFTGAPSIIVCKNFADPYIPWCRLSRRRKVLSFQQGDMEFLRTRGHDQTEFPGLHSRIHTDGQRDYSACVSSADNEVGFADLLQAKTRFGLSE